MKNVKDLRNAIMLSLFVTSSIVWGLPVFAADAVQNNMQAEEISLEEMVVTATRTKSSKVDIPVNTAVITAKKIASRHYQNVSEALKDVPGAVVIDSGEGASEKKVVLNGDERVLVLVDGKRVNFDMGTIGRSSYDLNQLPDVSLIERIEVVKGHGGALYGSDAVGGVINIITKKIDHTYGKVSLGFGSSQTRDAKAMYTIKEGKTGVTLAASKYKQGYYKYKDVADSKTKRWGDSKFENDKVSLKINHELTDTTNLEFGYDYSKFDGISMYSMPANASFSSRLYKKTNNINVKYDWLTNDTEKGYVQVYRNNYDYDNKGKMHESVTGFEAQQEVNVSDTNKLVFGASYRKAHVINNGSANYDNKIDNKALFVSDQWEFAPAWSLNTGVRYDNHSKAGSKTTWSVGLNKKLDEDSHVYLNWGQVFKAPTTDDLYYNSPAYGGYYGDPNLKPETGSTLTLGYGAKLAEKTEVNVNYFQSTLKDAIKWYYATSPAYVKNIDKQKKKGLELNVKHELNDNWDAEASYSYVCVKNNENDTGYVRDYNYIPNVYRLGVRYHNDLWNADLFLRAGSGADVNRTKDAWSKPAYIDSSFVTVDAAVGYKATKALSFYAKGYNLLNKAYAELAGTDGATYKYPAQGRRFIVGAEYTF